VRTKYTTAGMTPNPNRWHPVMLPDNYIRKMKQALGEVEAKVEAENRRERVLDDRPAYDFDQTPPDDDPLAECE
jgi:hypothetical protein